MRSSSDGRKNTRTAETHLHPVTASRLSRALADIAEAFDEWVIEAVDALVRAREHYYEAPPTPARQRAFRDAARQVVWEADSLGHPHLARIARSLERLIAGMPTDDLPRLAVDAHVDALRTALTDRGRSRDVLARTAAELDRGTERLLRSQSGSGGH